MILKIICSKSRKIKNLLNNDYRTFKNMRVLGKLLLRFLEEDSRVVI
jgi:hypothetical protein